MDSVTPTAASTPAGCGLWWRPTSSPPWPTSPPREEACSHAITHLEPAADDPPQGPEAAGRRTLLITVADESEANEIEQYWTEHLASARVREASRSPRPSWMDDRPNAAVAGQTRKLGPPFREAVLDHRTARKTTLSDGRCTCRSRQVDRHGHLPRRAADRRAAPGPARCGPERDRAAEPRSARPRLPSPWRTRRWTTSRARACSCARAIRPASCASSTRAPRPGGRGCVMVYNRDSVWYHLWTAYDKMIVEGTFEGLAVDEAFTRNTVAPIRSLFSRLRRVHRDVLGGGLRVGVPWRGFLDPRGRAARGVVGQGDPAALLGRRERELDGIDPRPPSTGVVTRASAGPTACGRPSRHEGSDCPAACGCPAPVGGRADAPAPAEPAGAGARDPGRPARGHPGRRDWDGP